MNFFDFLEFSCLQKEAQKEAQNEIVNIVPEPWKRGQKEPPREAKKSLQKRLLWQADFWGMSLEKSQFLGTCVSNEREARC